MNVNSNNSSEIKGHESTVKRFPFKSHKVWKFILCKNIHILDWLHVVYFGEVGERVTMATYRLQYCTNLLHSNIFVKQHEISFFSNYKETYWCSSFRYLQSFTFFFLDSDYQGLLTPVKIKVWLTDTSLYLEVCCVLCYQRCIQEKLLVNVIVLAMFNHSQANYIQ